MKTITVSRRCQILILAGAAALAAGAILYFLALQGIGIPCLFHHLTGLMCPGCGNSRAVMALLELDVRSALEYNLLFPLEFFYIGWAVFFCCKSYLKGTGFSYRPPLPWIDITALVCVLLWWLLRNLI